ncbi:hypothetical protein Patl1_05434 [Pistacia atlantica]|uniref:Uncharacterized protein n=1 Tax=Pistacia atlantica TaxID=434234 RepID=A0ACC1BPP7_9ROSI|nr:hypothetical protein Patl1_05434 [Pistacia atlantica]
MISNNDIRHIPHKQNLKTSHPSLAHALTRAITRI